MILNRDGIIKSSGRNKVEITKQDLFDNYPLYWAYLQEFGANTWFHGFSLALWLTREKRGL